MTKVPGARTPRAPCVPWRSTWACTVTSWAEFRQADHAAWATPGVTKVHNRLRVVT